MNNFPNINFSKIFTVYNLILFIFILTFAFCLITSVYTVEDTEVGILKTLGKITEITESGIHFKFPYPIQQVTIINIIKSNTFELGFSKSSQKNNKETDNDFAMLTSDSNISWLDVSIEWKVSDPKAYLLNAKEPENILKNAAISTITKAIANSTIDSLLGDGKIDIQNKIRENLSKSVASYNIGAQIVEVKFNKVEPPSQVSKSFEDVFDNIEQSKAIINKAYEYKNQKLPAAEGEAQKIKYEAEAYYQDRINIAKAEATRFNSLLKEYRIGKSVTKTRLLIETLEDVLPNANIYIVDDKSNVIKSIPAEKIGGE